MSEYELDEYGECDRCGETKMLAVTRDGKFCLDCIEPDDFDGTLDDLTPD